MKYLARTALVAALLVGAAACGDIEEKPNVGEQQRQACVDSGKVAIVENKQVIACVTVEQYEAILKSQPDQVVQP